MSDDIVPTEEDYKEELNKRIAEADDFVRSLKNRDSFSSTEEEEGDDDLYGDEEDGEEGDGFVHAEDEPKEGEGEEPEERKEATEEKKVDELTDEDLKAMSEEQLSELFEKTGEEIVNEINEWHDSLDPDDAAEIDYFLEANFGKDAGDAIVHMYTTIGLIHEQEDADSIIGYLERSGLLSSPAAMQLSARFGELVWRGDPFAEELLNQCEDLFEETKEKHGPEVAAHVAVSKLLKEIKQYRPTHAADTPREDQSFLDSIYPTSSHLG